MLNYYKYLKYKIKYQNEKNAINKKGGAKHTDEYTICEIENKIKQKPSRVLIYTLQFPLFYERIEGIEGIEENKLYYSSSKSNESPIDISKISILKTKFSNLDLYTINTDFSLVKLNNEDNSNDKINFFNFDRKISEIFLNKVNKQNLQLEAYILILRPSSIPDKKSLTSFNIRTGEIVHYLVVSNLVVTNNKIYPYLSNTSIRNPEYFEKYFSSGSGSIGGISGISGISGIGSIGGTALAYKSYYLNKGVDNDHIEIIFNTDNIETKLQAFQKLNINSHIIVIGHCCRNKNILSDHPTITCKDESSINNMNLTQEKFISYLDNIRMCQNTNKSIIINFNICNGQDLFVPKLIQLLNDKIIKPIIIAKNNESKRLGGISKQLVKTIIFEQNCGTTTFISFWNEQLGYININSNLFNIDEDILFSI